MHEDHRKRVKERFLKDGIENMPDHEVLELLLFFSIRARGLSRGFDAGQRNRRDLRNAYNAHFSADKEISEECLRQEAEEI